MSEQSTTEPIFVPRQGWSVQEVTFIRWLVPNGQEVSEGDPICLIETDKVETELDAPVSGTLRHLAEPDVVYDIGAQLGEIDMK